MGNLSPENEYRSTGRKHCGEKEKLLVTSNFSFSYSVFIRLFPPCKRMKTRACVGKGEDSDECRKIWDRVNMALSIMAHFTETPHLLGTKKPSFKILYTVFSSVFIAF